MRLLEAPGAGLASSPSGSNWRRLGSPPSPLEPSTTCGPVTWETAQMNRTSFVISPRRECARHPAERATICWYPSGRRRAHDHATADRVRPREAGDAAVGICGKPGAHPRFEKREIRGRHRGELRTEARTPEDDGPVLVEIGEDPSHDDLPRVDGVQAGA